jgi:hypothetical protein
LDSCPHEPYPCLPCPDRHLSSLCPGSPTAVTCTRGFSVLEPSMGPLRHEPQAA